MGLWRRGGGGVIFSITPKLWDFLIQTNSRIVSGKGEEDKDEDENPVLPVRRHITYIHTYFILPTYVHEHVQTPSNFLPSSLSFPAFLLPFPPSPPLPSLLPKPATYLFLFLFRRGVKKDGGKKVNRWMMDSTSCCLRSISTSPLSTYQFSSTFGVNFSESEPTISHKCPPTPPILPTRESFFAYKIILHYTYVHSPSIQPSLLRNPPEPPPFSRPPTPPTPPPHRYP